MPLLSALRDLVGWLQAERVPGMVIGGVAVSILGRPRTTRDIDALLLLHEERWEQFLNRGAQFGFLPRRSDAIALAQQARVLLVRHEPSYIDVDIVFGALAFEEQAIARSKAVNVGGIEIPLPTPEDLAIMKAVAHRPRDLADIDSLLDVHPRVDKRRIRQWVREFSAAMEMPEILNDLEAILARHRRRQR